MIPNAPSIVNSGYNPVVFASAIPAEEKAQLLGLLKVLGRCPEVPEKDLEAYAIVTAMGPTYLWFQFQTLQQLGRSFGLSEDALQEAMPAMLNGAVSTMYGDGLLPEQMMDLIPVKPLGDQEETIRELYQTKLESLFKKLTA
jgi:pyrroline-5-carboxylate reductase